ncbi:MAG: nitrogenase-associated protein [Candidatus Thiodiazotropha sp. (ex. Lucinisca nassula)]|nr:nitrogenase-associated protein [Candidatus Thiodiazotropha sp. (ex. Lucinisca nassula)]MBW9272272.1 nitrogenase-associated protein [Candidatus Thiodiazotropha sp. (ex. Lucinisca nassula)]PUB82178.1 MAG: nitrogenase-associated protein [gamma proteobacterium symbiont of Ctena orbiculata]PUB85207.1 MAG: nitrogenase-associated protein [gamma proteobacterium symbiont of Ctena orbiculata]
MSQLIFYEKPGCIANRKQKVLLEGYGHQLDVRDLLSESWTRDSLRPYFSNTPVAAWFNRSAPQLKEGWFNIHELDEVQALSLMIVEPILIRRPLMQLGELKQAGFADGPVLAALDIHLDPEADLQSCPMKRAGPVCEASA